MEVVRCVGEYRGKDANYVVSEHPSTPYKAIVADVMILILGLGKGEEEQATPCLETIHRRYILDLALVDWERDAAISHTRSPACLLRVPPKGKQPFRRETRDDPSRIC